jgi:prepilin-type N-terminal cleavage/methylation domain-containing protein
MCPTNRRRGFTLIELMVVMVVIIIMGAVLMPTITGFYGNSRQKATADMIQSRIREARAKAMETGTWYRLAISPDNRRIRLGPDCQDFDSLTPGDAHSPYAQVIEQEFEKGVTAEVTGSDKSQSSNAALYQSEGASGLGSAQSGQPSTWTTIMTFGPEGICREGLVTVSVKENDATPISIQVRGIVGSSSIVPTPHKGGGK